MKKIKEDKIRKKKNLLKKTKIIKKKRKNA